MRDLHPTVWLIVPCYNEAARLDLTALSRLPSGCSCVLVNDGSTDGTAALVRGRVSDRLRLLDLPANVGKGEAIRQGILHVLESGLVESADWVGYWDADLATPLGEIPHLLAYAGLCDGDVDAVFGSRVSRLGSTIERSYVRHLLGRAFANCAALLLNVRCYDSQCGAKLFRPALLRPAFGAPFESRWIFDLEILLRLEGRQIVECPVRRWTDVRGSKVNVLGQVLPTLRDLVRIRRAYAGRRQAGRPDQPGGGRAGSSGPPSSSRPV
jgi:glycosyltransferase involved in cell wall biosynthesis